MRRQSEQAAGSGGGRDTAGPGVGVRLTRKGRLLVSLTSVCALAAAAGGSAWVAQRAKEGGRTSSAGAQVPGTAAPADTAPAGGRPGEPAGSLRESAGLGPRTAAAVPAASRQVLVVTGKDKDSPDAQAVLYERREGRWQARERWPARNGTRGWTPDHRSGDLRSPVGVYELSDSGGRLARPEGTKLPYHRDDLFVASGRSDGGNSLDGTFDYVVAVDYNRAVGVSPLDRSRPQGEAKGGGIWLHVDHGDGTQGCVTLRRDHIRKLLAALDPQDRPVVVMGDARSLAS
ncbi:L,D-transpeptidase family protein [Streptomyces monticola]|uniref:L,D-transpeptidase family protein n=1 Tax=Streptomyces monticola TaxID=2666263 RepID=A0ABW2JUD8_9ACTN